MKIFRNSEIAFRILLNAIIIFHLTAIVSWSFPIDSPLRTKIVRRIKPYMLWTGLWQSWDMFAPNPLQINAHLEALVTFRDGTQRVWPFPRMEKLSYLERYTKERYRKWSSDYVRSDAYSSIWADTARYIARNHYNPLNPPSEVTLKRYWMEIPPPAPSSIHQSWSKEYAHNHSYSFYTYRAREDDFS